MQQGGTVALQTGFSDSNIGYNAAATGNAQQSPGMPYKSASDPNYPQRQVPPSSGQFSQYQTNQYGAQGYTQISSTTNSYPEGSAGGNKDLGVTDQELQALLSQKDIATSLAEDLLKHFGSEDLDVKEERSSITNNGTLGKRIARFSSRLLFNKKKLFFFQFFILFNLSFFFFLGTLSSGPFSPSNNIDDPMNDKIKEIKVEKIDDLLNNSGQTGTTSVSPKLDNPHLNKIDNSKTIINTPSIVETIKCEATSSTNKFENNVKLEPVLKLESLCDTQPENELNIEMDSKTVLETSKGHGSL